LTAITRITPGRRGHPCDVRAHPMPRTERTQRARRQHRTTGREIGRSVRPEALLHARAIDTPDTSGDLLHGDLQIPRRLGICRSWVVGVLQKVAARGPVGGVASSGSHVGGHRVVTREAAGLSVQSYIGAAALRFVVAERELGKAP
jgi:hypothetical protein